MKNSCTNSCPCRASIGAYQVALVAKNMMTPTSNNLGRLSSKPKFPVSSKNNPAMAPGKTMPTKPFASIARPMAKQHRYQNESLLC